MNLTPYTRHRKPRSPDQAGGGFRAGHGFGAGWQLPLALLASRSLCRSQGVGRSLSTSVDCAPTRDPHTVAIQRPSHDSIPPVQGGSSGTSDALGRDRLLGQRSGNRARPAALRPRDVEETEARSADDRRGAQRACTRVWSWSP